MKDHLANIRFYKLENGQMKPTIELPIPILGRETMRDFVERVEERCRFLECDGWEWRMFPNCTTSIQYVPGVADGRINFNKMGARQ